jgi:mRNA interferase RelE/StbE
MASYRIEWRRSTAKDLRKLPPEIIGRIVRAVESLDAEPRPAGCKKLSGSDFAYRLRVGDYRVIYEVFDDLILIEVVRVGHRKDIYRD